MSLPLADQLDLVALRDERLARLQDSMRRHGVEACLLFNEPNVRYATSVTAMPVWSNTTFVRAALVPVEGRPILFEHGNSIHRSRQLVGDVRPMTAWDFYDDPGRQAATWAAEMVAALRDVGTSAERVAVDRLGTPGWIALRDLGVEVTDSTLITQQARQVKTPQEIALFDLNGQIVVEMLGALESAIAPGVSERELLATLAQAGLSRGIEHLATNTVCGGTNGNPWRAEATDRKLRDGELVFVDTDTVGVGGAFFCVSRTFPVGDRRPTDAQRATYQDAYDWLHGLLAIVRPGITCGELAEQAPQLAEKYLPQRYECMIHGIGLEEENPSVCYRIDQQSNPDTVIEADMLLVVELYAGEVGGDHGVKLGQQIHVTPDGPRILAPYPFNDALLV
jgi:Xaa-Pro aminopeptidase